ncbi:VOC family protein [Calothrix sp. FACHB-156]|nr:VOC family protein [Calothrix sp. FACHB-156]
MQLNPYLMFNGQCETAFKFYEQCLGGKIISMMTYAESPDSYMVDNLPTEWRNKIMHVSLMVDNQELMGSDNPPEYYEQPKGFSVSISLKDPVEAERIFHKLAENGQEQMLHPAGSPSLSETLARSLLPHRGRGDAPSPKGRRFSARGYANANVANASFFMPGNPSTGMAHRCASTFLNPSYICSDHSSNWYYLPVYYDFIDNL